MHTLSDIDADARTAVCEVCGPTPVRSNGVGRWRCRTAANRAQRGRPTGAQRRRPYRAVLGDACERCGFVAEDPCQLDIHHRDGDHSNDCPENLATLCANCHRLEHRPVRSRL